MACQQKHLFIYAGIAAISLYMFVVGMTDYGMIGGWYSRSLPREINQYNCSIILCNDKFFAYQLSFDGHFRRNINHTSNPDLCNDTYINCFDYADDSDSLPYLTLVRDGLVYTGLESKYIATIIASINILFFALSILLIIIIVRFYRISYGRIISDGYGTLVSNN